MIPQVQVRAYVLVVSSIKQFFWVLAVSRRVRIYVDQFFFVVDTKDIDMILADTRYHDTSVAPMV